jgi:hypothetical protein
METVQRLPVKLPLKTTLTKLNEFMELPARGVVHPDGRVDLGVGRQHRLPERRGRVRRRQEPREEARERVPREPRARGAAGAVAVEDGEEVEVRVPGEARGDEVRVLRLPARRVRVQPRHLQRGVLEHQARAGHRGAAERGGAPPRAARQAALALRAPHRRARWYLGLGASFVTPGAETARVGEWIGSMNGPNQNALIRKGNKGGRREVCKTRRKKRYTG